MYDFNGWIKSKIGIDRWPPILFFVPLLIIIVEAVTIMIILILSPLIFIKPLAMWAFGYWKCKTCKRHYGIRTERTVVGLSGDTEYKCQHCVVADKLEVSK